VARKARIIVVGNLNGDFVLAVERLPAAGETLRGGGLALIAGRKAQIEPARLTGLAVMAGQIKRDPFAPLLAESL
jgi:hypothetical protein